MSSVQLTGTYLDDPALISTKFLSLSVLRAHNLPHLKTFLGKQRLFYATVTYGERTWRTQSARSVAQRVEWNESLEMSGAISYSYFDVQLSLLQLCPTTLSYHGIPLC